MKKCKSTQHKGTHLPTTSSSNSGQGKDRRFLFSTKKKKGKKINMPGQCIYIRSDREMKERHQKQVSHYEERKLTIN